MPTFQMTPVTVEAVQFTGDNFAEMHDFTGHFTPESGSHPEDVFVPKDQFPNSEVDYDGLLWCASLKKWQPVYKGDWIVQGPGGFTPWNEGQFVKSFIPYEEVPDGG
jgi:hypothetical protein